MSNDAEERRELEARTHKRKDECWELYTKGGNPHMRETVPLWNWKRRKELVTRTVARLMGVSTGPLTEPLRPYDQVRGRSTCIRFCINPAHLEVFRVESVHQVSSYVPTPAIQPPPPQRDTEGNITGPSPIYVSNHAVRPMWDENKERQDRKKVVRPGFAGKHDR